MDEVDTPDYAAVIGLYAASAFNRPSDWRYHAALDARRRAAGCMSRWFVVRAPAGQIIAAAWLGHEIFDFRPPHPRFWVVVADDQRRAGVGSALVGRLCVVARDLGAESLTTATVTPDGALRDFAARHHAVRMPGFIGLSRAVGADDRAAWTGRLQALTPPRERRGLSVATFAELRETTAFWSRYAAFNRIISADLPGPVPCTVPSDEALQAELDDTTRVNHAASQLAYETATATIVAVSSVLHGRDASTAVVGLTAVRAAYRRTGLAEELKLRAMLRVADAGARSLTTTCFEHNVPMLTLNERLGFRPAYTDAIWRIALAEAPPGPISDEAR